MNINLTELANYVSIALWMPGIILGPIVVYSIAKLKVPHVIRSTLFAVLLSIVTPLVFIQMLLLLGKSNKNV